jgi:hypothetical protein
MTIAYPYIKKDPTRGLQETCERWVVSMPESTQTSTVQDETTPGRNEERFQKSPISPLREIPSDWNDFHQQSMVHCYVKFQRIPTIDFSLNRRHFQEVLK